MENSSNDAPNTSDAHNKVSRQFFQNANAARINTDAHIFNVLQRQYQNVPITIVPQGNCNLKAYANAGHATVELIDQLPTSDTRVWPEALKWTVFVPPVKRLDGGQGVIAEESFFESYLYKWQGLTFLVYLVDGRDGTDPWPPVRNQYILGDKSAVHTLVATIGRYQSSLHNEVWVFQGSWVKDSQLYQNVMKSRWEDVILDKGMKDDLIELVGRFFSSREQYHRLRVPWKRGVIFYGPPGNGKTLSIKATMRTLYKRNPPIPTLYVKVLLNQYSIDVVFAKARQEAPCYLVFEDLDSLVTDRLRSFFLNAVDGISENEGVFMIGSTNVSSAETCDSVAMLASLYLQWAVSVLMSGCSILTVLTRALRSARRGSIGSSCSQTRASMKGCSTATTGRKSCVITRKSNSQMRFVRLRRRSRTGFLLLISRRHL
jgi:hypothetical protein